MDAFNSLRGAFCSQNPFLDTQILKQEWGFDGILMSDYQSIKDGVLAAEAGMDLDMPNGMFMNSKREVVLSCRLPMRAEHRKRSA
jgi:beta-glucosidase